MNYGSVTRGNDLSIIGVIRNTGNLSLILNLSINSTCCSFDGPSAYIIQNLSTTALNVRVHARLNESLGLNTIHLLLSTEGLSSAQDFSIQVGENPLLTDLESYRSDLDKLKADIAAYAASGVDVSGLQQLYARLENSINSAGASSVADDVSSFAAQVDAAKSELEQAQQELASAGLLKLVLDNKFWILLGAVLALIALYLLTQIMVPYIRLTAEIRRMADKEQSQVEGRKATYKDYFMGKVDEKAFEEMIIGKQSEILSTKGTLRHKVDERSALVKNKLSPKAVGDWVKSAFGLRPLAARLKAKAKKTKA
jgi:hypothetical protein